MISIKIRTIPVLCIMIITGFTGSINAMQVQKTSKKILHNHRLSYAAKISQDVPKIIPEIVDFKFESKFNRFLESENFPWSLFHPNKPYLDKNIAPINSTSIYIWHCSSYDKDFEEDIYNSNIKQASDHAIDFLNLMEEVKLDITINGFTKENLLKMMRICQGGDENWLEPQVTLNGNFHQKQLQNAYHELCKLNDKRRRPYYEESKNFILHKYINDMVVAIDLRSSSFISTYNHLRNHWYEKKNQSCDVTRE